MKKNCYLKQIMDKQKPVEAATLQKKKTTINKAKVKKTIKNTLCRPDRVFWPNVPEEQAKILKDALSNYKVEITEFKKPHWKELKAIPKDQRPKQPKIKKVEGFIFGLMETTDALKRKECSAVIIESSVNPRTLVYPVIEACDSMKVPVVCLNELRRMTCTNFGIPTACLAIKIGFLQEFASKVSIIAEMHKIPPPKVLNDNCTTQTITTDQEKMEVDENTKQNTPNTTFTYLYRTSKKTRVFNPTTEVAGVKKAFTGQDFIEFSTEQEKPQSKAYMSMILKRITNNQNRVKRK